MVAKIILVAALVAVASAQYQQYVRPNAYYDNGAYNGGAYSRGQAYYDNGAYNPGAYPDTPAKYQFSYEVADAQSGDYHGHQEARDGDVVQGVYSLVEPDGTRRIVEYVADGNGFNAAVRKEGQPNVNYNYGQGAYAQPAYRPAAYRPAQAYRPAYATAPVYGPAPVAYRNYKK